MCFTSMTENRLPLLELRIITTPYLKMCIRDRVGHAIVHLPAQVGQGDRIGVVCLDVIDRVLHNVRTGHLLRLELLQVAVEMCIRDRGLTENLYVGGSSAGAYIAMMLCFDPAYLKPYGVSNIQGYLFDAGQPTVHFRVLKERGLCLLYTSRCV